MLWLSTKQFVQTNFAPLLLSCLLSITLVVLILSNFFLLSKYTAYSPDDSLSLSQTSTNENSPQSQANFVTLSLNNKSSYHELSLGNEQYSITNSEKELWFDNKLFVFQTGNIKFGFCVIEKNSCTMFKQIFKRVKGLNDWLDMSPVVIHYQPFDGLLDESFHSLSQLQEIISDETMYLATFVRDPLERLVSAYIDKCIRKRGIGLCNYARWSPLFDSKSFIKPKSIEFGARALRDSIPPFYQWVHGIIHCPCWPEPDKHVAPQNNFCNLYQFYKKFDIFRFENRTHRRIWMQRANIWDQFGSFGWTNKKIKGNGNASGYDTSIVNFEATKHATNRKRHDNIYIKFYSQNVDVTADIIEAYRTDYTIFGMQMPQWMCNVVDELKQQDIIKLKKALRSLPRTSRPPCNEYEWLWIPP